MRHVIITQTEYDFDKDQVVRKVRASFFVGPTGVKRVEIGDVPVIPILDPESGRQVTLESDPELWADLLPTAFRSGGLSVETTSVDRQGHETPITRQVLDRKHPKAAAREYEPVMAFALNDLMLRQ